MSNNIPNEKKFRIVMVAACPFPANHGTPGAIRELSVELARLGHEIHIVTYPQFEENIPIDGLIIHRVNASFLKISDIKIGPSIGRLIYDFFLIPKLFHVIRKHKIDIIHTHNYEATIAGALVKAVTRTPLIYTGVNSMADELPSYNFIKPKFLAKWLGKFLDYVVPRAGDVIMALSDELKSYLEKDMGIASEKIIVIPPGVDISMFENGDGNLIRQRYGIANNEAIVMYTGALEAFQEVDYLFEAMKVVLASRPDAHLMIVTNILNEKAKAYYQQLATGLGISEKTKFIDSVSLNDLPDYLAAADVAVVPRTSCPGYPIKLLNYMAAGKAVVSFKGSAKAICHGYNGYVAEDANIEDMAQGILLFIKDPKLKVEIGNRAKATIPGVFDWLTLAKGTVDLYGQLIKNSGQKVKLDKKLLNSHLKGSYIPRFRSGPEPKPEDGFSRADGIEFPEF